MDDYYSEDLWKETTQRARLLLKKGLEIDVMDSHQLSDRIDPDQPLLSQFYAAQGACVRAFYLKQFGFLQDHIRPSELYRISREIETLQSNLTRDHEFRKQFFGQYLKSTGKNHKKVLRELRNQNIPFIISKIRQRTPAASTFHNLTEMTLDQWRTDILPKVASDKSIKYGAKKMLSKLFPWPVKYSDLKEWGVAPPDVDVVLTDQYYRQYHFNTWATGRDDAGTQLQGVFFLDAVGDTRISDVIVNIARTEEWRGAAAFYYETLNDFRSSRQRESDRESEKIDIAMFFRTLVNLQLGRCNMALSSYKNSKEALQRITKTERIAIFLP
jgi:hypothetical protein